MKKVLFLLVFVLVSLGLSAKVVRPVKYTWTVDHIPDGEYFVYVDWKTAKPAKDGCYLTFEIMLPERYTASMLKNLQVGDYIEIGGKMEKVRNKIFKDNDYIVNYTVESDEIWGTNFFKHEGYYVPCENLVPYELFCVSYGKVSLKVKKFHAQCDFDDVLYGSKIAPYILKNWKKSFLYLNCSRITVKNRKVVLLESCCAVP